MPRYRGARLGARFRPVSRRRRRELARTFTRAFRGTGGGWPPSTIRGFLGGVGIQFKTKRRGK